MLYLAALTLALLLPHSHGPSRWALLTAFLLILWRLLTDLREKT
jgi:hypothetical protein